MLCRASGCSIPSITCPCVSWSLWLMSMWKKGEVTAPKRDMSRKNIAWHRAAIGLISSPSIPAQNFRKVKDKNQLHPPNLTWIPKTAIFERRYIKKQHHFKVSMLDFGENQHLGKLGTDPKLIMKTCWAAWSCSFNAVSPAVRWSEIYQEVGTEARRHLGLAVGRTSAWTSFQLRLLWWVFSSWRDDLLVYMGSI